MRWLIFCTYISKIYVFSEQFFRHLNTIGFPNESLQYSSPLEMFIGIYFYYSKSHTQMLFYIQIAYKKDWPRTCLSFRVNKPHNPPAFISHSQIQFEFDFWFSNDHRNACVFTEFH